MTTPGLTPLPETADLRDRIAKLERINAALIGRLDRQDEARGSAYATFQAAMALEREIKTRNRELLEALSDLSQRNAELAQARAAAVEANRAKNRFLRAASHDLLQPLSAAKLFLAMLQDTDLDGGQGDLVARLASAFGLVEELMHAVLDIARLDSQRIEFNRRPVALRDLFQRLNAEFQHVAHERGLELRFAQSSVRVDSDPTFLFRIAQNLVSNALKYTERGGVLVGVRRRGARAWLEVRDSGVGIAAEDRNRIFDEFQRINPDQSAPGMGLGLSIVRGACQKLGHPISLQSEPGRGSVFRIGLPIVTGPAAAPGPAPQPAKRRGLLRGRRVMVIENDAAMAHAYRLVLGDEAGMKVMPAASTAEALAHLPTRRAPPQVILADYHLDGGDTGVAAIDAVRARLRKPDLPAVVVTANRDPAMQRDCRERGIGVLEKPVAPEELRAALRGLLGLAP
ncbi:hybrid sensor histidine kinase/response regulator [Paracoccus sp. p4-l81]|uniref:ATP-binding response regulator n=1 Tax=unclassified Paracoccus (in: a-proteobacteria) TaxID=2688777 RepID=UPI0035BAF297